MKKQSRTVIHRGQSDSQPQRHLPLVDILVNTQTELQALVVASGLKVLDTMLEDDRRFSSPHVHHAKPPRTRLEPPRPPRQAPSNSPRQAD